MSKPRVFLDAEVLSAGVLAPTAHVASHTILCLGEVAVLECVTSVQVILEVERTLATVLPSALAVARAMLPRCVAVVSAPSLPELLANRRLAAARELPLLVAALQAGCETLLTFHPRRYTPDAHTILIQKPEAFLITLRSRLARRGRNAEKLL
jgi:hypothetical protein